MTKLERAIAKLKERPVEMEDWARLILRELEEQERSALSDEQIEEIKRRLADTDEPFLAMEDVHAVMHGARKR